MITSIAHRINRSELRTLSRIHHIRGVRMNEIWMANASYEGKNHTPILSLYLCCNSCYDSHFAGLTFAYYLFVRQPFVHILCIYIYCLYCERENSFSAAINTYEFQSQPNLQKNVHFCSFLRFFFVLFWKKLMISHFIINFGKFGCMNAGREYGAQLLTTSGAL